jgi:tetratricopeptide (TPR) repeat protein
MLKRLVRELFRAERPEADQGADRPGAAELERGRAALAAGEFVTARVVFGAAVAANPNDPEPRIGLAETLLESGDAEAAAAAVRAALRIDDRRAEAHLLLSRALSASGRDDDALLAIQQAARRNPERAEIWNHYGLIQLRFGNLESAWAKFKRAVTIDPRHAGAWVNLAIAERRRGGLAQAVIYLKQAVEADPDSGLAWSNYGLALRDSERLPEAISALRRAIELRPRHAVTRTNLGAVLADSDELDEAEAHYHAALELEPELIEPRIGLAGVCHRRGQLDAALRAYQEAVERAPEHPLARTGLGQMQIWLRDFARGWDNYEFRLRHDDSAQRRFPFPAWNGEPIEDGRLLIYSEQGIGDMMLFASCVPDAVRHAAKVVLEAPPKLVGLFARSFPDVDVRPHQGASAFPEWLAEFGDVRACISAGSLMRLFRRGENEFPRRAGYLRADPERVARWRARLAALGPGPKVGVSWRGGFVRTGRESRSIDPEEWLPILRTPGCHFVSLQYTPEAALAVAELRAATGVRIHHWSEAIDDYEETAALAAAVDVVVTVCTALAHLSGALGLNTLILAPAVPSWRYLGAGSLPWYPTARIFRRRLDSPWRDVIEAAAATLGAIAPAREPAAAGVVSGVSPTSDAEVLQSSATEGVETSGPAVAPTSMAGTEVEMLREEGRRLLQAGDANGAITVLERVVKTRADWPEAYCDLASAYAARGDLGSAFDCLEIAVHHAPQHLGTLLLYARLKETAGASLDAMDYYERAAPQLDDNPTALVAMARLYHQLGREPEAQAKASRAIDINPGLADAHQVLGLSRLAVEDYAGAVEAFERCVAIAPGVVGVHINLGNAYLHCGRFEKALERLAWVIANEPNNHIARWDYAHLQLANREFERAWDNYEYRWHALEGGYATAYLPPWRGEPLERKVLLVLGEQGLGDQIMLASCYQEVIDRAAGCVVACEPRLAPLFRRSFPAARVFASDAVDPAAVREADYEVQAGSLPGSFRRSETAFPRHAGYLRADPARVAAWRRRLDGLGGGVKVGLSWRGGTAKTRARLRTIPLTQLAPLLALDGCTFASLQYGACEEEIHGAAATLGVAIHHFPEVIPDYDETAALVSALDVVITVCTSIVHLSGALGRPVWVLVPSVPEWRYCFHGETLPWYPSARLFRQAHGESWDRVIAEVAAALRDAPAFRAPPVLMTVQE